jgi:hypothetical protein
LAKGCEALSPAGSFRSGDASRKREKSLAMNASGHLRIVMIAKIYLMRKA